MLNRARKCLKLFITPLLIGFLFPAAQNLYGENTCFKYLKNYSAKDYRHYPQNWKVAQDSNGIIYVSNQAGILQFDGVSWRIIKIPNWSVCSLAIHKNGTIYIGGKDEIGFLAPDSKGTLQYVSLLDHLKEDQKKFSNVWDTFIIEDKIYFKTLRFLFRWDTEEMKVWQPGYNFNKSFKCESLFIHDRKTGLMQMSNDSLKLIPGGQLFAGKKIYMMARYDSRRILIGTRANGFFLYDGVNAVPFPTGADDYLKAHRLYQGIRLSSGDFALATLLGGVVVIDSDGHLKHIINKDSGLPDNHVNYVFEDYQGNLWLALNNGVSKIEYASPFSIYSDKSNLPGIVLAATRHKNRLYAGTTSGLFFQSSSGRFQPVPGISGMCWSILSTGSALLAATNDGIFQVKEHTLRRIFENFSFVLLHSKHESNRIWAGTKFGLGSLVRENGQWGRERKFETIIEEIRSIVEDREGDLWLGTLTKGVLKVDFPGAGTINNPVVTRYDKSHGLPAEEVNVFWTAGHVMFATGKGIFQFDHKKRVFLPDHTLGAEFAGGEKGKGVFRIAEDKNKNIWFHSEARNIQAIAQPDGTFTLNEKPFLWLHPGQVNTIYFEGDATWLAGNNGLIRYDTRVKKNYRHDFPALIRKVWVKENLVFDGCKSKPLFPVIDYKDRNLRFQFAAPFFENETKTQYQCLLEGYDEEWTAWTSETKKDYTNVDAGTYRFRVRAKNIYETLSREDVFQFKVLPPWYKTWWAFSIYALGFLLLMFLVVKWRSKYLEKEKKRLEKVVKDRTQEIEEKSLQLEKQTIQLQEQSGKLKEMDKVKSRFFANISHEFRTPLTLIMGPLEQILSNTPNKEELEKKAKMMQRNSQRLLHLINQLLELSKLDSGEVKLQAARQDIIPFLKGIAASFEPVADQNDLDLTFGTEEQEVTLYFDPGKMEEVMYNLLSNAVKFTPAGGKITVAVKTTRTGEKNFPAGSVDISICDTGPGISREQLAHIFDRFYQADTTYEYHQKGSGIGLAIAKELVELHHGGIEARSSEGKGTEFIIRLPIGDAHLKPGEIVEPGVPVDVKGVPVDIKGVPVDIKGVPADIDTEKSEKDIILVVEDSADVRDYIKGALEPLYRVVEAADGREGIQKAQEIIPDLIISDIMMPEVDGCELCRVLKNNVNTSHIPILLLTAKAAEENIIEGLETGADDYITKPFNTKILCARIKNLIDIRSQLQQNVKREMTLQPVKMAVSGIDREFLEDLRAVINKNLSDPDFNVEQLCKRMYMGRTTLYRKIHALSGESPTEFIRSCRLKRGAELLKKKFGTVLEVAFEVGFSNSSYFTKCFKEKFHQLPSEYQASDAS